MQSGEKKKEKSKIQDEKFHSHCNYFDNFIKRFSAFFYLKFHNQFHLN